MTDLESTTELQPQPRQLFRSKLYSEVPKDAILLTKAELLEAMYIRIKEHKNIFESWALRYHNVVTGGAAGLSAAFIVSHYRRMFKLKNFGRISTIGGTVLFTAAVADRVHTDLITDQILTGYSSCPLCLGTRSGLLQVASGIGYPLILAPLLCMVSARANYTYSVPSIKHRALFLNMLKTTFPFKTSVIAVMLANFIIGALLCDHELFVYERLFGRNFDPVEEEKEFSTDLK